MSSQFIMNYSTYYNKCKAQWNQKPDIDLHKFQFETVGSQLSLSPANHKNIKKPMITKNSNLDTQYYNCIKNLNTKLNNAINDGETIKTISYNTVQDINQYTDDIELICKKLLPSLSQKLYGCPVTVHRAYLYQNDIDSDDSDADPINNNKWHWGNCPPTVTTVIVYLSDVTNEDSHLEIMLNSKNCKAVTMPTNRLGPNKWGDKTHLRYKNCQLNGGHLEEFKHYGFQLFPVIGKQGHVTYLNRNIIHRYCLKKDTGKSNFLVMHVRPSHIKQKFITSNVGSVFDVEFSPEPY